MRLRLLFGSSLAAMAVLFAGPSWTRDEAVLDPLAISTVCGSEAASARPTADARVEPPKMLAGYGNGSMVITTTSPEAQRWFDHGLRLAQAFQHAPAKAAFAEAARLDPACAMCAWGQAWADGPTINYDISGAEKKSALKHALRAQALATASPEKERLLIAAIVRRYASGEIAWAKAMSDLVKRYPTDEAIGVLAADSQMTGFSDAGAKRAVGLLETVLARNPDHTGAIHFYIHATEWAEIPARAVPYADRLRGLAPAASHLIHMPSHTWYRVGRYRDAALANLAAIEADRVWIGQTGWDKPDWEIPYFGHNVHFALGGAMMAGEASAALTIADRFAGLPAERLDMPWMQLIAGSAWFARGRYEDPDKVLAIAAPAAKHAFMGAMRHYGRGEALARKGDAAGVRAEALAIKPAGDRLLATQAYIAREVLLGRAAMIEGRYALAGKHFRKAAERQEKVFGDGGDPPIWWYPVRRSLAAALLAEGQAVPALGQARAVLARWPDDPLSLVVAARAEESLGQSSFATRDLATARAGWAGDDLEKVSLNLI
jgi:hypothetical protein